MPRNVTDSDFETEVLSSELPVLVDFYATWCGPCQTMLPIVAELAEELEGRARVVTLDVEQAPEAVLRYGINAVPQFFVFKDGEVRERLAGARAKEALLAAIEPHVA